jgi:carbamoyltransferase
MKPNPPEKSDQVIQKYADLAASAQEVLEDCLLTIAKHVRSETGEENLCYAGGVALNGVANWRILKEAGFKNIYIHPAAGDSGGALGAALHLYHNILDKPKEHQFNYNPYLGPENSNQSIVEFLEKNNIKAKKLSDKELIASVAPLLAKGKVVGWTRGRLEWGPRALGNRSILADPRSKKMKDLVNSKIKFREAFRPFAPVCAIEDGGKYFDVAGNETQEPLQYMLGVVPVRKEWHHKLGAITHVNGTARPQFIKRSLNPVYYNLIKAFGKVTGVSVLLNTSFNLKGEPIVNTAEESYETFMRSGLDYLVIENYLIKK